MSSWVERAIEFTQSLSRFGPESVRSARASPPLTASEFNKLQSTLASRIPDSLTHFLRTESASCNCEYYPTFKHTPEASAIALLGAEMAAQLAETHV